MQICSCFAIYSIPVPPKMYIVLSLTNNFNLSLKVLFTGNHPGLTATSHVLSTAARTDITSSVITMATTRQRRPL